MVNEVDKKIKARPGDENIEEIDESSGEIKKPFDPTKIKITQKPLTIDSLIKRMKDAPPRIDLNTEFQRLGNLWDETTQSRLIESLLIMIPLPAFYFDGSDDKDWKVVDGLQRLTTLKNFIIDKALRLQNLEFLDKYDDCGFDDLPPYLQGRIEETQITAYIIDPGTPKEVKYNVFRRINTGGLVLTPQEIRHALNQGIPAQYVKELAELEEFHRATNDHLKDLKRMEDREFVTRFVAFYHWDAVSYNSDLEDFLDKSMEDIEKLDDGRRQDLKNAFSRAMEAAHDLFGEYAFRKMTEREGRKNPLNKALFETWSVNLAKLSQDELLILKQKKDKVIDNFVNLMNQDKDFVNSITAGTGKLNAVKTRLEKIEKLLKGVLS